MDDNTGVLLHRELDEQVYEDYARKRMLERLRNAAIRYKALLKVIGATVFVAITVVLFLNRNTLSDQNLSGVWKPADLDSSLQQIEFADSNRFYERRTSADGESYGRYGLWEIIDGQVRITIHQDPAEIIHLDAAIRMGTLTLTPTHPNHLLPESTTRFHHAE